MEQRMEDLHSAISTFLATYDEVAISASRPLNDLLVIWELATAIDPSVAAPVESLLTSLVGRELTTRDELRGAMDEVELALVGFETSTTV